LVPYRYNGTNRNRNRAQPSLRRPKEQNMTSTAGDQPVSASRTRPRSHLGVAAVLVGAIVLAVGVNSVIAALAGVLGAPAAYGPLTFPAFTLFTVLGLVAGWIGWVLVHRRASDPRRLLTVLVPVVTLVSLVPDVMLLAFRFIPGTTATAAIALMLMHLVVVAVAVPAYALASRIR
jgi:hypothetical protein